MNKGELYVDNTYPQVRLSELQSELRQTRVFEQTDRVSQLGLVKYTYEGATHTRRQHGLGTSILSSMFCDALDLSPEDRNTIEAAAMLHDVGHMAFAHSGAKYFKDKWGYTQEELSKKKILHDLELNEVLSKYGVDPNLIADLIHEDDFVAKHGKDKRYLKQLISSSMDVDRMDFLRRDARNVAIYGNSVEYERLLKYVEVVDDEDQGKIVVFEERTLPAIKAFFYAYQSMYESVYFLPRVQKQEAMLNKALFLAHDHIEEHFGKFKEDPSLIKESALKDVLQDIPDGEYGVAKGLIDLTFTTKTLPTDVARWRDFEEANRVIDQFGGVDLLEGCLNLGMNARDGEIIVMYSKRKEVKGKDVFVKLADTGIADGKVVSVDSIVDLSLLDKQFAQSRPLRVISIREDYREGILEILREI